MKLKMFCLNRFVPVCLLLLLGVGLFSAVVPQASAAPTLQSKIVEVKDWGTENLSAIDITSNGTIIVAVDNDFWRSDDHGESWTKVKDHVPGSSFFVHITTNDIILAQNGSASASLINDIWKSSDYGNTWNLVIDNAPKSWRLAEMSNGTLLINTYAAVANLGWIYKSDDGGDTWQIFYNFTGFPGFTTHIHCIRVNPYNDDIWVATGDAAGSPILKWSTTAGNWIYIKNASDSTDIYTDILFDSKYVYFIPDTATSLKRMPFDSVSWSDAVEVLNILGDDTTTPTGIYYSMMGAIYDDGLMVIGTDRETIYATADGERWLKIFQTTYTGSGAWRIDYISQRRDPNGYWYFINDYTNKVYRASVNANDVKLLFNEEYNDYLGTKTANQWRIPVSNGSKISFNITSYNPQTFHISIVGLSKGNFITNPSFETGNLSGWTVSGSGSYAVTTADKQHGSYSLQINKSKTDTSDFILESTASAHLYEYGECWWGRVYIRANRTMTDIFKIQIGYYDSNNVFQALITQLETARTYWYVTTTAGMLRKSTEYPRLYIRFIIGKSSVYDVKYHIDTTLFQRKVRTYVVNKVDNGNTIVYKLGSNPTYDSSLIGIVNTENVSIDVSDPYPDISYNGVLSEGESKDYIFALSNRNFDLTINVAGSGQVLIILTFSYPKEAFVLFSNAELLSEVLENEKLTLTINSPSGTTSTTLVYVGDKGNATEVWGATSWIYNASTKILTLNVLHNGLANILIDWRIPGDVTGNGRVDASDLTELSHAYGSTPALLNWNQDCDFNRDNIISVLDLHPLGRNYGKTKQ